MKNGHEADHAWYPGPFVPFSASVFVVAAKPGIFDGKSEALNAGQGREFEVRQEEAFEVELTALFFSLTSGHYQQNLRSQKLNDTSAMEQGIHF